MCPLKFARIVLIVLGVCQLSMFDPFDLESYIMTLLIVAVIISVQFGIDNKRILRRRIWQLERGK